ncbi:hypothetical protein F3Y22_tig00110557pilonHSYRG00182 [Hibiscus syriacus]|uniref:Uncharacterized protein n=1 Tax=Hibiscus syriacus TaxID=106335 RepID=A0A6A3A7D5_HIBSY|nr:hypothetical protein F3Y22_tig00110557pilonHSYRG00182 [Hibiscus syriacus]
MADEERVLEDQLELQLTSKETRSIPRSSRYFISSIPCFLFPPLVEEVKAESLDPDDIEAKPLAEEKSYQVGSKCRFRCSDGWWDDGQVVALNGSDSAKISFLTPTSENMLKKKGKTSVLFGNIGYPCIAGTEEAHIRVVQSEIT